MPRSHIRVRLGGIRWRPGDIPPSYIWLQVSGDGGETVEKFVVQQFIWPCPSMRIDQTRRPTSTAAQRQLRETLAIRPTARGALAMASLATARLATDGPRRHRARIHAWRSAWFRRRARVRVRVKAG